MTPKEIYDAALLEVNSLRQRLGMAPLSELPKGVPGDGGNCPITRALNCACVEDARIEWKSYEDANAVGAEGTLYTSTPRELVTFIAKFDDLKFPEVVERET